MTFTEAYHQSNRLIEGTFSVFPISILELTHMPRLEKALPEHLKPFQFHGLPISYREGSKDVYTDCIFCDTEGKFGIKVDTGQYKCNRTPTESGNGRVFIRNLYTLSDGSTTPDDYAQLAYDRGLLYPETVIAFGLARSAIDGTWLLPGYSPDKAIDNIYRYVKGGGRSLWMPTPGFGHKLFGLSTYDPNKKIVHLCEGLWDAMCLWEMLRYSKVEEGVIHETASVEHNLLADSNVIAIPAAEVFFETWGSLFADKIVFLWAQNDHERIHERTGDVIPPASYHGIQRISSMLLSSDNPPLEMHYLNWGEKGFNSDLPHGYDIRDLIRSKGETIRERVEGLQEAFEKMLPVPKEWLVNGGKKSPSRVKTEVPIIPCSKWSMLVNSWKKAMKWIDGLDVCLSVVLSSIASTRSVGDQLWIKVISPASTGKSIISEALAANKKWVVAKSTIRGFHSGFGLGNVDNSLIAEAADKTLVVKDGDTLIQSPNLGQILSEGRDIYDTTSRTHYRTGKGRDYEGKRMTWILCGTASLRSIDSSELGERFLDCVIMDGIDEDLEDEILWRVANRTDRNMSFETTADVRSQLDPAMLEAYGLTSGYIDYLRNNATDLLSQVEASEDALKMLTRLGKFVACMRARPSKYQDEKAEREFAARLVSQLTRLAKCLAVVLNRTSLDEEVMRRVKKVAFDTARGTTLNISHELYRHQNNGGMSVDGLATITHSTAPETRKLLKFLREIGVTDLPPVELIEGTKTRPTWYLTGRFKKLYEVVHAM